MRISDWSSDVCSSDLPKAVWTQQPEGTRAFKLTCPAGAVTTSSIALTGDLSSYFDVVDISGDLWLVHNATSIPDALAGSCSPSVVQPDAEIGRASCRESVCLYV